MDHTKAEKIKEIVERLKAKKKKHKLHLKGKKPSKSKDESKHKDESKSHRGVGRPEKRKAVMQGPHGGEYVLLGNGKKKYGVSKSMLEDFVKENERNEFLKKHKGES